MYIDKILNRYLKDIDETPNDWMKITDPRDAIEIQLYDDTS